MFERYRKPIDEPLLMYECIQLLDALAEKGIILRAPDNFNNIIVYRSADELNPEGWYSQNLMQAAEELTGDVESQRLLRETLEERGGDMVFENLLSGNDHLKNAAMVTAPPEYDLLKEARKTFYGRER